MISKVKGIVLSIVPIIQENDIQLVTDFMVLVGNSLRQVGLTPILLIFRQLKAVAHLKFGILKSRLEDYFYLFNFVN
jgi:hypothetical protein